MEGMINHVCISLFNMNIIITLFLICKFLCFISSTLTLISPMSNSLNLLQNYETEKTKKCFDMVSLQIIFFITYFLFVSLHLTSVYIHTPIRMRTYSWVMTLKHL